MTTTNEPPSHPEPKQDEEGLEELLREVGPRDGPSAETMLQVQTAVHAEWRAMLAERRKRRQTFGWAVAASVAVAVGVATLGTRLLNPAAQPVATVAKIDGQLQAGSDDRWTARVAGQPVLSGEALRTDGKSRAAVSLGKTLSLRLDRDTVVKIAAVDRVTLSSGAVYIDSPGQPGQDPLSVQTVAGTIRHVGTQYEVRTQGDSIDVSVREGRVTIAHSAGATEGNAGEKIHVTSLGKVARDDISPRDPGWAWAASAAVPFDIEGQSLASFLRWVARETGRRLVYASAPAQAAAEGVKLKGSISELDFETALTAVLATTQLRQIETRDTILEIAFTGATDPTGSARPIS